MSESNGNGVKEKTNNGQTEEKIMNEKNSGRDAKGRFVKGNPGGPGNPFARQMAAFRQKLMDVIERQDFEAIAFQLMMLARAGNLEAIISQRLLICRDGSRRPATEILRGGPVPHKYIMEGRALELHDYMRTAGKGQHTFDQDLLAMHRQELIII